MPARTKRCAEPHVGFSSKNTNCNFYGIFTVPLELIEEDRPGVVASKPEPAFM